MIKKKGHPKFNIPNAGAKNRKRVKDRWRVQRGLDSKKRMKKAFMGAEPTIGYRNPESVRHLMPNGKRAYLVHNEPELRNMLADPNLEKFEVIIASAVGKLKRKQIIESAKKEGIRVRNGGAK
jgi:Ribosomal protein L32E